MKIYTAFSLGLLISIAVKVESLYAQSCLNCWINPLTGQQESLERLLPSASPVTPKPPSSSSPQTASPPSETTQQPSEGEKKPESSPPSIIDDPRASEQDDTRPLPQTQVDPRLRFQEAERRLENGGQ